jgi:hypothetical protein
MVRTLLAGSQVFIHRSIGTAVSARSAPPALGQGVGPGAPSRRSQHQRDNDRVVGITEHRDEVWNQVDRHGEVGKQQREPDPTTPPNDYGPPVEPVATICTARSTPVTPLKSGQS